MRRSACRAVAVLLLLVASACAGSERTGEEVAAADSAVRPSPEAAAPATGGDAARDADGGVPDAEGVVEGATRQDTLMLEGMPEPVEVRSVTAFDGTPIGFETVVPADMEVVAAGDSVSFVAAFGGRRSPAAALTFRALGAERTGASAEAAALAGGLGAEPAATPERAWATEEYRLTGERSGFLALGSVGGEWFVIVLRYPPEYGDGMGPRAAMILDRWRWSGEEPLRR